jgi:hypothetical protein
MKTIVTALTYYLDWDIRNTGTILVSKYFRKEETYAESTGGYIK